MTRPAAQAASRGAVLPRPLDQIGPAAVPTAWPQARSTSTRRTSPPRDRGDGAQRIHRKGSAMTVLRIDRFTVDPTRTDEMLTRRNALVAATREAGPGLLEARLARVDDQTWVDMWRWDSLANAQGGSTTRPGRRHPRGRRRVPTRPHRHHRVHRTRRRAVGDRTAEPTMREARAGAPSGDTHLAPPHRRRGDAHHHGRLTPTAHE